MPPNNTTLPNPNPSGLCQCGCGSPAPIAKLTIVKQGKVKGLPQRFICGHNRRKTADDYEIDPVTQCWNWLRSKNDSGYGLTARGGRTIPAHVWFWEQLHGPVPEGLELDHVVCHNRGCCNPAHVEAVAHALNCQRGRQAKLTREQANEILALKGTMTQAAIARRFGIDPSQISLIHAGKAWVDHGV